MVEGVWWLKDLWLVCCLLQHPFPGDPARRQRGCAAAAQLSQALCVKAVLPLGKAVIPGVCCSLGICICILGCSTLHTRPSAPAKAAKSAGNATAPAPLVGASHLKGIFSQPSHITSLKHGSERKSWCRRGSPVQQAQGPAVASGDLHLAPSSGSPAVPGGRTPAGRLVTPSPLHILPLQSHLLGLVFSSMFMSNEGVTPAWAAQGQNGTCNELGSMAQRAAWKGCAAQTLLFSYHSYCLHEKGREEGTCMFCFFFQFIKSREGILGIQDFFLCSDCVCFSTRAFPRAQLSPAEVP